MYQRSGPRRARGSRALLPNSSARRRRAGLLRGLVGLDGRLQVLERLALGREVAGPLRVLERREGVVDRRDLVLETRVRRAPAVRWRGRRRRRRGRRRGRARLRRFVAAVVGDLARAGPNTWSSASARVFP